MENEESREYAPEEISRELIEGLLALPPEVVKGIYVFGSHAFGTATPQSDWDFYTVVDGYVGPLAVDAAAKEAADVATGQTPATSSGAAQIPDRPEELRWEVLYCRGNVDMTVYEAGNWQEMLDYQDLHSILCQHFLPSSLALKNSPERFSWELDLMRLKHSVNAYVWSHHMLSRQFMKRKHHVRGRKCMIHCLRTMLMANNLVKNKGKTVDLSVNELANQYYREVMQLDGENLTWHELDRWFHLLYHPLRLEFRQGVNDYRRKMALIQQLPQPATLSTIDYIRISLQEEEVEEAGDHPPTHQAGQRHDLSFLKRELSLRVSRHHLFPNLVQLNQQLYSSPAQCAVVRECSGLVLDEDDNWRIACQGFPRLFHYTEDEEKHLPTITEWGKVRIYEISPGLSITLYWYSDRWLVSSTSNSFIGRCLRKRERARIRRDEGREMDEGRDWNRLLDALFWRVWKARGYRLPDDRDKCYMFRLVTQGANVDHLLRNDDEAESGEAHDAKPSSTATVVERLVLVGVRDRATAEESLPKECARANGWECPTERSDLAALAAEWVQQGEPTVAERREWSRRGGGYANPDKGLATAERSSASGGVADDEAVAARKRQKYVLDKLVDKCWESNLLETQGVIVCGPGLARIVVHTPPHTALASLGPYTCRHTKEDYFLTIVRTTFDHKERFCHYYPDWAHWYRYVHALLVSLCDETDRLYMDTLSKLSYREMGVWFHEQQRLNTKESKRGKLLKSIYKTNAAALESKQQQQQQQQQQLQQQQQQLQQYLQSAQRHVAAAAAAAASSTISTTSSSSSSPPLASGWEAPALPSHFLFGLTSSSPPPPPMSSSSASSSSSAPSPSPLVAPPPAPAPPMASLHAGMKTSYSVLRKSRRTEEGEEAEAEGKNETAPTTEQKSDDQQPATTTFTCPICNEADITEDELYTHTTEKHADAGQVRMVCPICAVRPNGNPNYKSRDYLGHLDLRHKPARLRSSAETAAMEAAAAPPQLRQSRPRTHLITRTARGFQMISNRSLDTLFDYLIHVDSDLAQLPPCQLCHRKMKPTHTRAILACGHHFHAQCLPSGSPSPVCPLCERKAAYFAAKASAAASSTTLDQQQPQTPEQSDASSSSSSSLKREEGEEAEAEAEGSSQGRSEGADENEMTCED